MPAGGHWDHNIDHLILIVLLALPLCQLWLSSTVLSIQYELEKKASVSEFTADKAASPAV